MIARLGCFDWGETRERLTRRGYGVIRIDIPAVEIAVAGSIASTASVKACMKMRLFW